MTLHLYQYPYKHLCELTVATDVVAHSHYIHSRIRVYHKMHTIRYLHYIRNCQHNLRNYVPVRVWYGMGTSTCTRTCTWHPVYKECTWKLCLAKSRLHSLYNIPSYLYNIPSLRRRVTTRPTVLPSEISTLSGEQRQERGMRHIQIHHYSGCIHAFTYIHCVRTCCIA